MFINDEIISQHLKNLWDDYFSTYSFYKGYSFINGINSELLKDLLKYLIKNFKQDISFDYLYDGYINYVNKKYIKNNLKCLDKKMFERQLKFLKLNTYLVEDDDYTLNKYVCFDNDRISLY